MKSSLGSKFQDAACALAEDTSAIATNDPREQNAKLSLSGGRSFMSQVTVNRIASVLERDFTGKIDMSDWVGRSDEERRTAFLSRALAALCIKNLAVVDATTAGASVTDGYEDGGIDAFYFDQSDDIIFFVQTKWSKDGSTPLNGDGSTKFLEGVTNILSEKLDRFNNKITKRAAEIRNALYSDRNVRVCLVTAHNAAQPVSSHVKTPY